MSNIVKNKTDKNKARAMYNYSKKSYEEERRNDAIGGAIIVVLFAVLVIALISAFVFV